VVEISPAQVSRNLLPLVPQFPADGEPGLAVPLALLQGKGLGFRSTGGGALPAGQFLVAVLGNVPGNGRPLRVVSPPI